MPVITMTDAALRRLKAPPGGRVDYFDAALPGFALRVTAPTKRAPDGRRAWILLYRAGGAQRRLTFAETFPALGLAAARILATKAMARLAEGKDPAAVQPEKTAGAARGPDTIAAVVDDFIAKDLRRKNRAPRYIDETRRNFRNHVLPRWADRDIRTITRREVTDLLDRIVDEGTDIRRGGGTRHHVPGGPIAANRVLAAIRALFNWAVKRGIIDFSPVTLVEKPAEETHRERVLAADEIRAVWAAATRLEYPMGPFFQLVLITAQRRNEVAQMRWADLDLETGLWTLPATATKARRAHVVPLPSIALDIFRGLPRPAQVVDGAVRPGTFVFSTTGDTAVSGFAGGKVRLDRAIAQLRGGQALPSFTIHDLRRTAATEMARLGIPRLVIGKILNHADQSVTGIYDRHSYLDEKRDAFETWSRYLAEITGQRRGNVVPLLDAART